MNYLDILILAPLLWGAFQGYRKGLIIMVVSFIALLLGVYGAFGFSDYVSVFMKEQFGWDTEFLPVLAFVITFILIVVLVNLLGRLMNKVIETAHLGILNKAAGILFGLLKYLFILSVAFLIFARFDLKSKILTPEHRNGSLLYRFVAPVAPAVFPYLREWYDTTREQVKEVIPDEAKT